MSPKTKDISPRGKLRSMRTTLVAAFLLVGLLPLAIVGLVSRSKATEGLNNANAVARRAIDQQVRNSLTAVRELKRAGIERYFKTIEGQILTFTQNRMVVDAITRLRPAFKNYTRQNLLGPQTLKTWSQALATYYRGDFLAQYRKKNHGHEPDLARMLRLDDEAVALQHVYIQENKYPLGSKHKLDSIQSRAAYDRVHAEIHPIIRTYLEKFGYYDIFLVDPDSGDILYSVFKELDFATSLKDGPYARTNFAEAFRRANTATNTNAVVLVDYARYSPSYEAPAAFIASPVFDNGQKVGVALFQMPLDSITAVMSERQGLGKTGESFLIGGDRLMRSDSHHDKKHRSVVASFRDPKTGRVETPAARKALAGESGVATMKNYAGKRVLSAYGPVNVGGLKWALLVEVEEQEAFAAMGALEKARDNATASLTAWTLGLLLATGLLIILGALLLATKFVAPLKATVAILKDVAQGDGDLTKRITVQGRNEIAELGSWFNVFMGNIHSIVSNIKQTAASVEAASKEISSTTHQIAQGTSSQASSVTETAAAVEEMAAAVRNNADNATDASTLSGQAQTQAEAGHSVVQDSIGAMGQIEASSEQISKIIVTIDEISFQINLLSLNAAVEAARAGAHGKGFGVIAAEIRKLAQGTTEASKAIRELIAGAVENIDSGTKLVGVSGDRLNNILESVEHVTNRTTEIAAATQQQSQGLEEINHAIAQIDTVTQDAAAATQQLNATSSQLQGYASEMAELCGRFKTDAERPTDTETTDSSWEVSASASWGTATSA